MVHSLKNGRPDLVDIFEKNIDPCLKLIFEKNGNLASEARQASGKTPVVKQAPQCGDVGNSTELSISPYGGLTCPSGSSCAAVDQAVFGLYGGLLAVVGQAAFLFYGGSLWLRG